MSELQNLDAFFQPRSVAVVGASSRETSVGHALLKNLLFGRMSGASRDDGFPGRVFAVNPKGGELLGEPVYPSLAEVPGELDLVVVAIPPRFIASLMDECGAKGVHAAIIITAGFAEMGDDGLRMQNEMRDAAARHGIRLIGPNCLGVLRPKTRLNASFAATPPPEGSIGLLSQSGALVTGIISDAERERFGLSAAISLGAKADIEDEDIMLWLAKDEQTKALAIYVEAFPDPRRFFEVARSITPHKPIVAIKGGTTDAGAKAASSHTGSLAGSRAAYEAAFTQSGVLQAKSVGDFIGWSRALACQPPANGKRIAVITNAGGPGVLAADAASRMGLELASLSADTIEKLNGVLPAVWSHNNPIDVIGDATPKRYQDALDIIGSAPEVDGIVVILTVQAMTDPQHTADAILAAHQNPSWSKPLCGSFIGLAGTPVGSFLDANGIPEFNTPERAVSAMSALVRRGEWLRRETAQVPSNLDMPEVNIALAKKLVSDAQEAGQRNLDLARARDVLGAAGIRYNQSGTATDDEEAVSVADTIGYPVVIKLISPDVIHKSDVGGVVLNVADANGVRGACAAIRERVEAHQPGARITAFTVEEQVSGTEIIVGMSRDPDFGPLMMVGMGGIFVEVYKDVSFRLMPLEREDALAMINEIKAQALLDGARGRPRLNRDELGEVLIRISRLVSEVDSIEELDLNPLVITNDGLVSIDARVIATPRS